MIEGEANDLDNEIASAICMVTVTHRACTLILIGCLWPASKRKQH